jgi:hypothetical protein
MHTPTNRRSLGRLDRAVAALSAVAICDAMRIGFLSVVAENPSARGKTSRRECLKRYGKSRARVGAESRLDADFRDEQD